MRPRLMTLLIVAMIIWASPARAEQRIHFKETGFSIEGRFLQYWQANGGLEQFGFPISPVLDEPTDGGVRRVQYFERSLFELHPEHAPPYDVLLSRLGVLSLAARGIDWRTFPKSGGQPGCRFFPETEHTLCEPFLSYWERHGALPVFGLPLSQAQPERSPTDGQTYLVQYFERNRMEHHPEHAEPFRIQLGLLGSELYAQRRGGTEVADPSLRRLIDLTNAARQQANLPPLRVAPALMRAAEDYSRVLASRGTISHTGPDGSTAGARITTAGYRWGYCAENLAAGQSTPDDVFNKWMNSAGHRANILRPEAREIGVGRTHRADDPAGFRDYWVMELAAPR